MRIPFHLMITPLTVKKCPTLSPIIWPGGPESEEVCATEPPSPPSPYFPIIVASNHPPPWRGSLCSGQKRAPLHYTL
jgi:hypothetical protein